MTKTIKINAIDLEVGDVVYAPMLYEVVKVERRYSTPLHRDDESVEMVEITVNVISRSFDASGIAIANGKSKIELVKRKSKFLKIVEKIKAVLF